MPPGDWRLRIDDILEAISRIDAYTRGMTAETFGQDSRTIDAVVRNLETIGEASRHKMRGLRNVVAHEYFGVDVGIIWHTVKNDLPPLEAPLRRLLGTQK